MLTYEQIPKSKASWVWMCLWVCRQTHDNEQALKMMQLGETTKFLESSLNTCKHDVLRQMFNLLFFFFYFHKLYYEIWCLWLLRNVKSMYSFQTDNCRELLCLSASIVFIVPFSHWKWSDALVVLAGHLHNTGSFGSVTCSPKHSVLDSALWEKKDANTLSLCSWRTQTSLLLSFPALWSQGPTF